MIQILTIVIVVLCTSCTVDPSAEVKPKPESYTYLTYRVAYDHICSWPPVLGRWRDNPESEFGVEFVTFSDSGNLCVFDEVGEPEYQDDPRESLDDLSAGYDKYYFATVEKLFAYSGAASEIVLLDLKTEKRKVIVESKEYGHVYAFSSDGDGYLIRGTYGDSNYVEVSEDWSGWARELLIYRTELLAGKTKFLGAVGKETIGPERIRFKYFEGTLVDLTDTGYLVAIRGGKEQRFDLGDNEHTTRNFYPLSVSGTRYVLVVESREPAPLFSPSYPLTALPYDQFLGARLRMYDLDAGAMLWDMDREETFHEMAYLSLVDDTFLYIADRSFQHGAISWFVRRNVRTGEEVWKRVGNTGDSGFSTLMPNPLTTATDEFVGESMTGIYFLYPVFDDVPDDGYEEVTAAADQLSHIIE